MKKNEAEKPVVKVVDYFDDRFYKIEVEKEKGEIVTEYYPSVTTILGATNKPWLAKWRGDVGNREADFRMKEGRELGSTIHDATAVLDNGGVVFYNNPKRPSYTQEEMEKLAFQRDFRILTNQEEMLGVVRYGYWVKEVNPIIQSVEMIVHDHEEKVAGTLDRLFVIKEGEYAIAGKKKLKLPEGHYVVDLKTGKQVDDDAFLQTAAYGVFVERLLDIKIAGTIIIHTNASTNSGWTTKVRSREEVETDFEAFQRVNHLWRRKFGPQQPSILELPAVLGV